MPRQCSSTVNPLNLYHQRIQQKCNEDILSGVWSCLCLVHQTSCSHCRRWLLTHQLELSSTVIGVLDALVGPQGSDGRQVVLENFMFHHAMTVGHRRPSVKRHHGVSVLLVGRFAPWDVEFLSSIHQHSNT